MVLDVFIFLRSIITQMKDLNAFRQQAVLPHKQTEQPSLFWLTDFVLLIGNLGYCTVYL